MFRRRLFVLLGVTALTAVACGGGGGGGSTPAGAVPTPIPSATGSSLPQGTSRASFSITVPASTNTSSKKRGTKTVPAGATSIKFTLVQSSSATAVTGSASAATYGLTVASNPADCTLVTSGANAGATTCIIPVAAPVGTDIFTADVYDSTSAKIGSGTVGVTIVPNSTNNSTLTLTGTVASVLIESATISTTGTYFNFYDNEYHDLPGQAPLSPSGQFYDSADQISISPNSQMFVIALDANNNQIIAPDTFTSPVELTITTGSATVVSDAFKRKPLDVPSADGYLQVTYAFPNGVTSATSQSGNTVAVLSPADNIQFITNNPNAMDVEPQIVTITATIQGAAVPATPPPTSQFQYFIMPGACNNGNTPPYCASVATPTPTPSPSPTITPLPTATPSPTVSPTPCPAGENQFGTCGGSSLVWSGVSGGDTVSKYSNGSGDGNTYASVEYPSIVDPSTVTATVEIQDQSNGILTVAPATSGQNPPTLPANNAANCALFNYTVNGNSTGGASFTVAVSGTDNNGYPDYQFQINEGALTAGTTCVLSLTGDSDTLFLTIYANNVTGGTVQ